jgi:[acyl-carrier-protein] S-malonyltransferase
MTEASDSTIAFMFPGQGSQAVGMGKALAAEFPEARAVFEEADETLGFSISKLCFEGPEDQLKLTENTQPAILTASIAALRVLEAHTQLRPRLTVGHSLGEISALVAAGSLGFAGAVRLARLRGQAMQAATPDLGDGAPMAAILGLEVERVEALCRDASRPDRGEIVTPANLNGGGQIVVAGNPAAVERLAEAADAAEARVIPLKVSAPFHCPLMQPAAEKLAEVLAGMEIAEMQVPVISCVDAEPIASRDRVAEVLVAQVTSRVKWEDSVRKVLRMGCTRGIEVGTGKVLKGLVRRIDRSLKVFPMGEPKDLEKLPAE